MFEFLEGFDKRMQIVAVADLIVNRKNRNMEIEHMFNDKRLDNVAFSVLVFIMEQTLTEDTECNMKAISAFLYELLNKDCHIELSKEIVNQVSEYIIKNILQNDGLAVYYPVMKYPQGTYEDVRIKLIDDRVKETPDGQRITYYVLTEQGYDFLFRTKEVDQEISFSVEEFKLRELIKRKNYKKALQQSMNLIQMVRQKKRDIGQFMLKIRENIYDVDIGRFEDLVNSTYELLTEEYEMLGEIMHMVKLSEERIREDYSLTGKVGDDIKKAQREIAQIRENLNMTLSEQRDLIISRQSLSKIYAETISEAFSYTLEKRFDIEEEILKKLEQSTEEVLPVLWQLLNNLFLPDCYKHINIGLFYEPQGMLKTGEETPNNIIEREEMTEDIEKHRTERINDSYVEILDQLFRFTLKSAGQARFSDFIKYLQNDEAVFMRCIEDRMIFTTLLKLYDIGFVDINNWRIEKEDVVMNVTEEFSLEYCLTKLSDKNYFEKTASLLVAKIDQKTFEVETARAYAEMIIKESIETTDFMIKVEMNDGNG